MQTKLFDGSRSKEYVPIHWRKQKKKTHKKGEKINAAMLEILAHLNLTQVGAWQLLRSEHATYYTWTQPDGHHVRTYTQKKKVT